MNKKTSYIIIFSLLVVLTIGIIFTDYAKQLGTILADASVPNPGHSLSEIEGGQDLATKEYVDSAIVAGIAESPTNLGIIAGTTVGPVVTSSTGTSVTLPTASAKASGVVTTGNQTWAGIKTFNNTIIGTGIIASASGGIRPACNASARGLMWYEYGSSGQRDKLYICQKFSNDTYAYTAVTADDITGWDCGDDFIDPRDSNIYPTVQIGTQCWMAKNLAYLPSVVGSATGSETTPYYYVYDYNGTRVSAAKATSNYTTYGVLYNWPAAMIACPIGWHLPTDAEQHILENYLSTGDCYAGDIGVFHCDPAGTALKEGGSAGFNAKLGGYRYLGGSFNNIGSNAYFWSSTATALLDAIARRLSDIAVVASQVNRDIWYKEDGMSVRCLRD